ncbi:FRG domain-containing protein [uncultured Sphingomonas sp.]|uniref:FRG domain-containing protein n=1 Tax=uncultured Sphingomonas sp. TaxID=158754 RepID=UPI003749A82A
MTDNFSYIAFGSSDFVVGDIDRIEMTRGRMFEYTPPELTRALEALDDESKSFIEDIPAFLCTEFSRDGRGGYMFVKFGDVSNLRVEGKEVVADFDLFADFGRVDFDSIEQARRILNADSFQLYRTHWAVRSGDIESILAALAALKPDVEIKADLLEEQMQSTSQPPIYHKKIAGIAESVDEFLKIIQNLPARDASESFFRGHEDEKFELTPSLLRKSEDGAWLFFPKEDRLCKELLIAHYGEFEKDSYCFDRLVRMQHYGLPTRLLDISSNPLVALFFACYGRPDSAENQGEVIVIRVSSDDIKYYDSDTVSCLSNLSNLTYSQKNEIDLSKGQSEFNDTNVAKKLLHHIRAEKGFFEGRINPDDIGSVICVKAKQTNNRIKSQAGAFLLFGHETTLPEEGGGHIEISRITIKNKAEILRQLDIININATTVYPSINETAMHLRERYRGLVVNE